MQNVVPDVRPQLEETLADRALADRRRQYADEVRRLIDAAFTVMRTTGSLDPPVRAIVREAGLSNQAFYRHFASRDALLLAVLADGRRRLLDHLTRRLASTADPSEQLRRFVSGILAQARNRDAADATRPFAVNGNRLFAQFPEQAQASRAELVALVVPAVRALGGTDADAVLVHDLAMARMHDALVHRRVPDHREVQQVVDFCLAGVRHGA